MATPSLTQARNHYQDQLEASTAAVLAMRRALAQRATLMEMTSSLTTYQYVAAANSADSTAAMAGADTALTIPESFVGVSSAGFPLVEPIVSVIDAVVAAPVEAVPDVWWTTKDIDAIAARLELLVQSEVADAARAAGQTEFVARPDWTNYVRMLTPPSCGRCVVLAGRIYRDLEAFDRHPGDDCVMVPVESWQAAHDEGYVSSPQEAFDKGHISDLSEADAQAIRDGADIAQVVNARRGMTTATVFGRRVRATTAGTTRRAAWRRANPTRLVRLRPDAIYKAAEDRADAIRLLRLYGYIT